MRKMQRRHIVDLAKNVGGASMVEFALVIPVVLLVTFGITDLSVGWWQWHSAEKAMQIGTRYAVVADPVAIELPDFDCKTSSIMWGTACSDPAAAQLPTIVCDGSSSSCTNGYTFSTTAFDDILSRMQIMFAPLQAENLVIEYADAGLGFAGRPGGPVPTVTLRIQNLTWQLPVLNSLLGLPPLTMPTFYTTLTGESFSTINYSELWAPRDHVIGQPNTAKEGHHHV